MRFYPLSVLFLGIAGCASGQILPLSRFYPRDAQLSVNQVKGSGVVVAPLSNSYEIEGKTSGDLDVLTISTCHREIVLEDEGKDFRYMYTPILGLEDDCPVVITGLDKKKEKHSWGFIDFEHPDYQLPAEIYCNGSKITSRGVSICQAPQGTIQKITFIENVKAGEECPIKEKTGKEFTFEMKVRESVCVFYSGSTSRAHKMTTLGYDQILIERK